MQTDTITLRELTIRYSVKADAEGRPICLGRTLSTLSQCAAVLMTLLPNEPCQVFGILCLSTKHRVIANHEVSRGALDAALVHPRNVFRAALMSNTASIILAHSVPGHRMRVMCPESLCGRGQWEPPITPVDALMAAT